MRLTISGKGVDRMPGFAFQMMNRISKRSGFLFIDNGHQSRDEARSKIADSGMWEMVEGKKRYMKWRPLKKEA